MTEYSECPVCGDVDYFRDTPRMLSCQACGLAILKDCNTERRIELIRKRIITRLEERAYNYGYSRRETLNLLKKVRDYAKI